MNEAAVKPDIREFTPSDGYPLHYRFYPPPENPPRGYVIALHGIQSHGGWYEHSSRRLAAAGYEVSFLDRRGSGLNERERGHAAHADRLVNDVAQFLAEVRFRRDREAPSAPVILSAVSWGGKLAAVTCARRPELVDALVLSAPGICAHIHPNWHQRWRLNLATAWGLHHKLVPIPLDDPAFFTDDAGWRDFIRDDALSLHHATVSLLQASVELDAVASAAPDNINCPTLLLLAGRDRIIDNDRTKKWFDRIQCPGRDLIEYPAARHTLEFEPNRDEIIDITIDWLGSVSRR